MALAVPALTRVDDNAWPPGFDPPAARRGEGPEAVSRFLWGIAAGWRWRDASPPTIPANRSTTFFKAADCPLRSWAAMAPSCALSAALRVTRSICPMAWPICSLPYACRWLPRLTSSTSVLTFADSSVISWMAPAT